MGSIARFGFDLKYVITSYSIHYTKLYEEKLEELSQSIKQIGIIQPLTLRVTDSGMYQIIAGERRFRASKLAA